MILASRLATAGLLLAFSSLPALVGCGATTSDGASEGDRVSDTSKLAGSHTIILTKIDATLRDNPASSGDVGTSTRDVPARLDLRSLDNGELEASITSQWGTTVKLDAFASDLEVVLQGGDVAFVSSPYSADTWDSITLTIPRQADGTFGSSVKGNGTLTIGGGDYMESAEAKFEGTIARDTLAPELRLIPAPEEHGGKWLPWDPIYVQLSEPLSGSAFASMVASLPEYEWADVSRDGPVTKVTGTAGPQFPNAGPRAIVGPTGLSDLAGNPLAPFRGDIMFHDVGWQNDGFAFDNEVHIGTWGDAKRTTDEASCDGRGCIRISQTGNTVSGVAGVILPTKSATGATRMLRARTRVIVSDPYSSIDTTAPKLQSLPFGFQVFANGQAVPVNAPPAGVTLTSSGPATSENPGVTTWTSDWFTLEVAVPADAKEIGFSFEKRICIPGCSFEEWTALVTDVRVE